VKIHNLEPNTHVYDMIIRQTQFYQNKKYTSLNAYKYNYLYFVDDVNVSYTCSAEKQNALSQTSTNMELIRQVLETQMVYSNEEKAFISMNNINFVLTSTCPGNYNQMRTYFCSLKVKFLLILEKSDNFLPLNQRLTKHLINVHLSSDPIELASTLFTSPLQNWLEEFPPNQLKHPFEMAQVIKNSFF
jgi:hypothetical protein